jgi:AraC-like DNA-binding protein
MNLAESKMAERAFYQPGVSSVESAPTALQLFLNQPRIMLSPHWHAQVEVNFIVRGWAHYKMAEHEITLSEGDMCLFWGGLPHQMDDRSDDVIYAGAHLPLVHFFRLHLPGDVARQLMMGVTLVTDATGAADRENFERWNEYWRSGDPERIRYAVNELLLRLERVRFEPYRLVPEAAGECGEGGGSDQQSSRNVSRMCDFIAENFLYDIDSAEIAAAAGIHPRYAMSVFRKWTGMTLNEYVSLLRLSYAQAMLMTEQVNVMKVAMDCGFGSLSAFNKSFRKLAGMSPSDFRKVSAGGNALADV